MSREARQKAKYDQAKAKHRQQLAEHQAKLRKEIAKEAAKLENAKNRMDALGKRGVIQRKK